MSEQRMFPILRGPTIPWEMIAPHEAQAKLNHGGQDLEMLARRGGLCPEEAVAAMTGRRLSWAKPGAPEEFWYGELSRMRDEWVAKDQSATIAELRAELAARDQRVAEQAKMLHDLTPGGSEYVDNPKRCFDWIQDHMSDLLRDAVRLAKERNGLRRERDALLAHFNACSDCHDCAVESGTLIVTVVETEETVNVRTP